jgi:hypothetical protein
MRWLVVILEWLVLLPLWRRIFKPKVIQGFFAAGTALVWLIVIIAVASSGGGDGEGEPAARAQASPTVAAAAESPTAEVPAEEETPEVQETPEEAETPEPPPIERIVAGVPGAVAEAEDVRITLSQIVDPWVSDNMFIEPASGKRFVSFEVTIEQMDGSHLASDFNFQLTDAEGFASDPTFGGPEPALPTIDLGKGQKTQGWVLFEVNEGTALKLLKYDPNLFTTNDIEFQFD